MAASRNVLSKKQENYLLIIKNPDRKAGFCFCCHEDTDKTVSLYAVIMFTADRLHEESIGFERFYPGVKWL